MGGLETTPCDGRSGAQSQEGTSVVTTEERWWENVACRPEAQRELREEFAGGALKSMEMSRCSREAATEGSDSTGEWSDRAKHS